MRHKISSFGGMAKPGLNIIHYLAILGLFVLCMILIIFNNGLMPLLCLMGLFFGGRLGIRKLTGHASNGLGILKNSLLVILFIGAGFTCSILRTETNYYYFLTRTNTLKIKQDGEWVLIHNADRIDVNEVYSNPSVVVQRIDIKRNQKGILGRALNLVVSQKVNVFIFKPTNAFYLVADPNNGFAPLTVSEANTRKESSFLINASFYDPSNRALGEVIYCSKQYQTKSSSSGYFKVIDGVPHAGPRSVFDNYSNTPQYSCQAHPSTMKDGVIFQYILDNSFAKWRQRTYRNLVGEKADGSIVCIASGNGGLLDVREISQLAKLLGVKHATLFDAGIALQYAFNSPGYSMEFSAFNNLLDAGSFVDKVGMELFRKNFIQRSPVYIGITLNE
jgi:hypothetical protein